MIPRVTFLALLLAQVLSAESAWAEGKRLLSVDSLLPVAHAHEAPELLLEALDALLNDGFFFAHFSPSSRAAAYELAQEEDFDLETLPLLSPAMKKLMGKGIPARSPDFAKILMALEGDIQRLPARARGPMVARWRALFLARFGDHMRYLNSLRKNWRLNASVQVFEDSNINLIS
ncbi:MAG: hypothetical protein HQL31_04695, partial [Planctomycetes bacterium]|nr:hypothetical protein [Planctomycetota bacterium]